MSPNISLKKLRDTEIKNAEHCFYTFKSRDHNLTLVQSPCDRRGRRPGRHQWAACTRSPSRREDGLWGQRERCTHRSSMPGRGSLPRRLSPWWPVCSGQGPAGRPQVLPGRCSPAGLHAPARGTLNNGTVDPRPAAAPVHPCVGAEQGPRTGPLGQAHAVRRGRCALCIFPGKFLVDLGFWLFFRQLGAQNMASGFSQAVSSPPPPTPSAGLFPPAPWASPAKRATSSHSPELHPTRPTASLASPV